MADPSESSARAPENWQRGFWALIVTQFQGAFSDNALRFLVTFMGLELGLWAGHKETFVSLVGALFSIPFIVFSMAGGYLADRYSKRSVTIGVKVFEIGVMVIALAGLAAHNLMLGLACVFLMGTHSAFFGPSKYGSVPELLDEKRLSWGNGVLELGTYIAIILGAGAGAVLFGSFKDRLAIAGVILIGLAVFGLFSALGMARIPAADSAKRFRANFVGELWEQVGLIRTDRVLWLAVLGNVYFSFLGVMIQQNIVIYGSDVLRIDELRIFYLLAALAVGVGVGSYAAGYLSGRKIEYGLVPLGSIGMTVFGAMLAKNGLTFGRVASELAVLGFFGGFFIVPVSAIMQHRPDRKLKGIVLASANLLSFVGVFLASGVYSLLTAGLHFAPSQVFLACALGTLLGTVYVAVLLPDSLLRLLCWMVTHSIYRIRVEGRDNIPERVGALFVSNHMSFVDALLVQASTDRPIRFIIFKDIYEHPLIKPVAKMMRAIPISAQSRPRALIKALHDASEAIRSGDVVCIFAEGQITRIGQLLPFRRGMQVIMKGVDAPIVPINLDGVWGSIFSFEKGRFLWKWPRRVPYPVTVSYGKPMPSTATPFEVRTAVQELHTEAYKHRRELMQPLQRALVRTARHHPLLFAMADQRSPRVSYGAALVKSIYLARRLRSTWRGQEMVGICLPPSVPGALVNYAAMLMGKVPVNLNYTLSDEGIAVCAKQCGLKTIVTSKMFLERVKLNLPEQVVLLEEVAAKPSVVEKLAAFLMAWTLPVNILEQAVGRERRIGLDDLATVIFSSGSTGEPKGVMLTHFNIGSNIEQMGQTFAFTHHDRILGILPFFHSFGFTATLMLPSALGVGVVFHANPLDAKAIGELVRMQRVTFVLATPTFLQMYIRGCEAEDFGSVQFVMAGAEKLPDRVALAFEEKFGVRVLEGYGCTECAPAVTVNTRDFRAAGFRQVGAKRGKIGHPLPGISLRVLDPDTMEPLPVGKAGLLAVKGPNVMKGYLGRPEKTAEVLRDGWYVTGDIGALDEDGFVTITDRLGRFSKIGGEMVPHGRIEEKLHEIAGVTEQTFAVTGVPDEKKGERLIVLHTLPEARLSECVEKLAQAELPNLWKPRADQFVRVEKLPYLGTGKLDLRKVRDFALKTSAG